MTTSISLLDGNAPIGDDELRTLLERCYVDEGFSSRASAAQMFVPAAVRARGEILHARDPESGQLLSMLILVLAPSPACRFATSPDEAELHLLATAPEGRGKGLGQALVEAALEKARALGKRQMLLWTQPPMLAAQRLYARTGFNRAPERDFARDGKEFLFYVKAL